MAARAGLKVTCPHFLQHLPQATELVVALDRGMTVEHVIEALGPPESTGRSEDGLYDVLVWSRRSIRAKVHDPNRSCSAFLTAKVSFRAGLLVFVVFDYRLV